MILPLRLEAVAYRAIIEPLTLELEAGPSTVLLGANGAGKSVLMRLMHGLLAPTEGKISWSGENPRRHQAMVFQRPVMLRRSALANVVYALKLAGVADAHRAAMGALEEVGLAHVAHRSARVLSGGEQQRLALARALARDPQVLFLDEPTASLDPAATKAIEDVVRTIAARNIKVVMSTHDLGEARRLAGEIVLMHRGRVIESGAADTFVAAPRTEEARRFIRGELLV
jgi:tungstate transport system ATP-binding protein